MASTVQATEAPTRTPTLWQASGGARYAFALVVDALGAGLLRPFLILYAVTVAHVSVTRAGVALSAGLFLGLGVLPSVGRWVDRGARRAPLMATLLVRVLGIIVLVAMPGVVGFFVAALLLGIGTQVWPMAHAAVVASLAPEGQRDRALAATRSLRNAGLGVGAMIATLCVTQGPQVMRLLALATAGGCLAAAVAVGTTVVPGSSSPRPENSDTDAQALRGLWLLMLANLPFALCFDVLEVAVPILLVIHLHVGLAWSSGIFVGNTVAVIATQIAVVGRLSRYRRSAVFAASGALLSISYLGFWASTLTFGGTAAAGSIALVSLVYTAGEIVYAGVGTALVVAAVPARLVGRALARWQLSAGVGRAAAPLTLTGLLTAGPALLWLTLALTTVLGSAVVYRYGHRWQPAIGAPVT
ncbi:MAG: hypothetical protein QOI76_57 [Frankiales bacterium]|nr:hypothetical protein [Frankiales bacterium]